MNKAAADIDPCVKRLFNVRCVLHALGSGKGDAVVLQLNV